MNYLKNNDLYRIEVCHHAKLLRFSVCDKDHAYSEKIGEVKLATGDLLSGDRIEGKFKNYLFDAQDWLSSSSEVSFQYGLLTNSSS